MSDELDKLNDVELARAVAREVLEREIDEDGLMRMPDQTMGNKLFEHWERIPLFATSADAVLPLLEKYGPYLSIEICGIAWHVTISNYDGDHWTGAAPTFARAACIALIRAKRAEKGRPC